MVTNATQKTETQTKEKTTKKVKRPASEMGRYIAKLHKKTDNKTRLSYGSLTTINEMVLDILREIAKIVRELKQKTKSVTITINDIKAAIRLIAGDGELSKHCIMEGSKAVMKFEKK